MEKTHARSLTHTLVGVDRRGYGGASICSDKMIGARTISQSDMSWDACGHCRAAADVYLRERDGESSNAGARLYTVWGRGRAGGQAIRIYRTSVRGAPLVFRL